MENKKKILVVESNPEHIAAAKEAYSDVKIVDNLKEAMENLKNGHSYDAVISGLYLNGSDKPEGIDIGKRCLENKIPLAILANGEDREKINKLRVKHFNDKDLVKLVGDEDPLDYMIANANFEINKSDPNVWKGAYKWANLN